MKFCVLLTIVLGCSALKVAIKKDHKEKRTGAIADLAKPFVKCDKDDGLGAQVHCKMVAFAKSRHDGKCYFHAEFVTRGFHHATTSSSEATKKVNEFMGLHTDTDKNCTGPPQGLGKASTFSAETEVDTYFTPEVRAELRAMYWSTPKPVETDKLCQVAFHVRRGDVSAGHSPERFTSNEAIVEAINLNFAHKTVCIFSEGSPSDFGKIQQMKVRFHLNGDALTAFHNLVSAPELVIAKSSFSFSAGVLNSGNVFYLQKFWHNVLGAWSQTKASKSFASTVSEDSMIEPPKSDVASEFVDFD